MTLVTRMRHGLDCYGGWVHDECCGWAGEGRGGSLEAGRGKSDDTLNHCGGQQWVIGFEADIE